MGGWKPRYCRLLKGGMLECYKWDRDKKLVEGMSVDLNSVRELKPLGVSSSSWMSFGKAPPTAFQLIGVPCHESCRRTSQRHLKPPWLSRGRTTHDGA